MNIVLDLDSTLVHIPVLEQASINLKLDPGYTMRNATSWDMVDLPVQVRDECYDLFQDSEFMTSLKPKDGSEMLVQTLVDHGHKVMICTCRNDTRSMREGTLAMVNRYFPGTELLYLTEPSKHHTYAYVQADVVVDDCPLYIAEAEMAAVPIVLLYYDEFTPYNIRFRKEFGIQMPGLQYHAEKVWRR